MIVANSSGRNLVHLSQPTPMRVVSHFSVHLVHIVPTCSCMYLFPVDCSQIQWNMSEVESRLITVTSDDHLSEIGQLHIELIEQTVLESARSRIGLTTNSAPSAKNVQEKDISLRASWRWRRFASLCFSCWLREVFEDLKTEVCDWCLVCCRRNGKKDIEPCVGWKWKVHVQKPATKPSLTNTSVLGSMKRRRQKQGAWSLISTST